MSTMTLKEATVPLRVSTTLSVRRILELDSEDGRKAAHAGYDELGRTLVWRRVVEEHARKRANRGNWRVDNLGQHAVKRPPGPAEDE